jgi:hypothetical protein
MCPAPRLLEIRREDANLPTTAPGSSPDRARPPLGKASCTSMRLNARDPAIREGVPLIPAAPIEKGGSTRAPPVPARWCSALERKSSCCGVRESADRVGQRITEHPPKPCLSHQLHAHGANSQITAQHSSAEQCLGPRPGG